jgi:two-component system sensor histidine kinase BaeS
LSEPRDDAVGPRQDGPEPRDDAPGPPDGAWRGRADGGRWTPGSGPPPWVRRRWQQRHPPRAAYRPFGCLFLVAGLGLAVLAVTGVWISLRVVGHLVALATGSAAAPFSIDPVTAASAIVFAVALVTIVLAGRTLGGLAGTLDDLLDAAGRVEGGDYAVRVTPPGRGPRGLRELVGGFNTMTARLEADERQRRSLLADVSHELRTPLAVVQGTLEAILDGVYPADAAHLEPLVEETRVLARLVEDLRTVALADAGTLALHREPTDLGLLAGDVAAAFGPAASERGVTIRFDSLDLPVVDVDPVRIRQVLDNVVANAVRHSPRGGAVALSVRRIRRDLVVEVRDDGPGIPAELRGHVFERFAKDADSEGSGLGLAIARGLVEAHGGRIEAESPPSGGTTIRFTLPMTPAR